jgi:hypothetical protein
MLGYTVTPVTSVMALTLGSSVALASSLSFLYAGQSVSGTGVPANTTILGFGPENSVFLSNAATSSGSFSLTITDPLVWSKVRIGWQQQGQPGPDINSDTLIIYCYPIDTPYSRLRDNVGLIPVSTMVTQQDVFTRSWRAHFTFYGPNSLVSSKLIQSALIKVPFVDYYLTSYGIFINPSIEEPKREPELFQGEWWERVDLIFECNEQVTETYTVGTVASVEVKVYSADGLDEDFTVET